MIELKSTDRMLILGENGSGKTFLAEKIIRAFPRVFIISPYEDEFVEYAKKKQVKYTSNEKIAYDIMMKVYSEGNIMLVVDDADLFLDRYTDDPEVKGLLIRSRHRNVGYIMIARRSQDMPKLLFKVANKVFIFQTDMKLDLKVIEDNYGEENALIVKGLNRDKHEFLFIDRERRTSEVLVA
jgi:ABC-type dipeptide/oligopeptide/nickel transport system ATPase component